MGIYFEIYNLTYNEFGQTEFRVNCSIGNPESTIGTLSSISGFFKRIFSDEDGVLGSYYDYQGNQRDEKLFVNFKVPEAYVGTYAFAVETTDLVADKSVCGKGIKTISL